MLVQRKDDGARTREALVEKRQWTDGGHILEAAETDDLQTKQVEKRLLGLQP